MVKFFMKINYIIVAIVLICSCNSGPDIKTGMELPANFTYRYDKNSGVTHIQLNAEIDSVFLNALLDTGCPGLVIDKRIASKFPKLDSIRLSGGMTVEDVFYSYSKRKVRRKLFTIVLMFVSLEIPLDMMSFLWQICKKNMVLT